jgi:hypothetical protein
MGTILEYEDINFLNSLTSERADHHSMDSIPVMGIKKTINQICEGSMAWLN